MHKVGAECIFNWLAASVDGVDINIAGWYDDYHILTVGIDMKIKFRAHELGNIHDSIDSIIRQLNM